jgi:hypothetical protein
LLLCTEFEWGPKKPKFLHVEPLYTSQVVRGRKVSYLIA